MSEIRTVIPELKTMIEESVKAVASFNDRPGLLEYEEYWYSIEEHKIRMECLAELQKAKLLMRKQKCWRWKAIKLTNGNPIKILFLGLAWWKNFKIKSLWQRK